jgi:hypothetical protein
MEDITSMTDASASESGVSEMDVLKQECSEMVSLLKKLEKEEHDLRLQNEILAREALLCGFDPSMLGPPAPKRRKSAVKKPDVASSLASS